MKIFELERDESILATCQKMGVDSRKVQKFLFATTSRLTLRPADFP
jgi:hypothetical protein